MAAESTAHPAYGQVRPVTDFASVLLRDNPGLNEHAFVNGFNTQIAANPIPV